MAEKATRRPRTAKVIRCSKGYSFKKIGRNQVALMRGTNVGATFECKCDVGGSCEVKIKSTDPKTIECLKSACTGECDWHVKISGIAGLMFRL